MQGKARGQIPLHPVSTCRWGRPLTELTTCRLRGLRKPERLNRGDLAFRSVRVGDALT